MGSCQAVGGHCLGIPVRKQTRPHALALAPRLPPGQAAGDKSESGRLYLDGGDEGRGEVGAEARGQGQLAGVLVLPEGTGDGLLAQQLKAGHPVLHTDHVQGWAGSHQQPGVSVAPADGNDGALLQGEGRKLSFCSGDKQRKIIRLALTK